MINQSKFFSIVKIFFSMIALVGFFMFIYLINQTPDSESYKKKRSLHNRNEEITFDLQGFHYLSFKNEKKNISIKADRLFAQKQSVGFFRFALLNEIKFINAFVVLYETSPATLVSSNLEETKMTNTDGRDSTSRILSFNSMSLEDIFRLFPIKRITSIKLEPVSIELHYNDSLISRISANSATIRLKHGYVLFEKNVRVDSDNKLLMADNLRLYPNNSTIEIDQNYILDTPQKRWEGKGLLTDISLTHAGLL
jgi:hypothetical protein